MGKVTALPLVQRSWCTAAYEAFVALYPALRSAFPKLTAAQVFEALTARLVLEVAKQCTEAVGLPESALEACALSRLAQPVAQLPPLEELAYWRAYRTRLAREASTGHLQADMNFGPRELGAVYETLLGLPLKLRLGDAAAMKAKKRHGSYYTPTPLTVQVVLAALEPVPGAEPKALLELRVLDPAVGAGAFLIQACLQLSQQLMAQRPELDQRQARALVVNHCLYGVDLNPLSVAVTEVCLWLCVADPARKPSEFGKQLKCGDALIGMGYENDESARALEQRLKRLAKSGHVLTRFDWRTAFPEVDGFDVVMGNPPWVAYAGRSAVPLAPSVREYFAQNYAAWRGFPTLHGLFVERAASLAPRGTVALLLPSPVADLDGYRSVRAALTRTHRVRASMTEFGQDAFEGVTQPCFALLADSAEARGDIAVASTERWLLSERQRVAGTASTLEIPKVLELLQRATPLERCHFGEMGFQTTRVASETLLLRAEAPDADHAVPLLEGRNVFEFRQTPPKLFLRADPELLRQAKCRLRGQRDYVRVSFVVRQTAPVPVAALHGGLAFRNSLLGGFASDELSAALLVALLNSSLYRALHVAGQRDARQAAFPQVKVGHLRMLPRPPKQPRLWRALEVLTQTMTAKGVSDERRHALDELTFELFAVPPDHRVAVLCFLSQRIPRYAPKHIPPALPLVSSLDSVRHALALESLS